MAKWDKIRAMQSFETAVEAKERSKATQKKIEDGIRKPTNHIGNHSYYIWDKAALEEEVYMID
jgi:hypothetical protein